MDRIIAWDLGTGGNKASLYDRDGNCVASTFVPYETSYPDSGWHEQRPEDWWGAVIESTRRLLASVRVDPREIVCCGLSGHSLGAVPVDRDGNLLRPSTPIWSDCRATPQAREFFTRCDQLEWYRTTGNGFPPPLYSVFKIMWYRDNEPEMFSRVHRIVGTKDFVNLRLTGRLCTDPSYASGSGVYDLLRWNYSPRLIEASGLPARIFPEIVPSTQVIGRLTHEAAEALGLHAGAEVVAGGVDNSCMALGAKAFKEGRAYNNLGSSSWIAVCSSRPLIEEASRPYVFAHVVPGMFASALAITAAGSSFRWIRDQLAPDLVARAERERIDAYDLMVEEAARSPRGARGLLFNPSLGGGMPLDKSARIRGGFLGLDLGHRRADLFRAAMEGIALGLRLCLDELRRLTRMSDEMLIVGGGSKSALWRQIYSDAYGLRIVKSSVDQQAAALGAAAVAAVGTGLWEGFDRIDGLHRTEEIVDPVPESAAYYDRLVPIFKKAADDQADLQCLLHGEGG
ncbi:MAG TPA: FGGY-family carbohydrate kinase [Anaeromyxobacter sp.]|nr:FGGY-family carbohydrate kinase [Anaeromyxobacter sp.]